MNKTICDLSGRVPAIRYKLIKEEYLPRDVRSELIIDMCDSCAREVLMYLQGLMKVVDVSAVVREAEEEEEQPAPNP